ncbi:phosphate/phosphite/phosphonate ABC transporter substrate-binding protein [Alkaliphilus transvaalensis]|uniref:phosphate/phosphite/phosphonate ABC transporter substrate-binding protein n=1 Tax=Alkaliphilus transvaalensis TaxID=114628 RepID=UPI00047C58EB|nr:PhnD/SsuA/transferrin family substrate-binding protein [Alkaliphilus transvaalensis]
MKKMLILAMSILLVVSLLAGCGSSNNTSGEKDEDGIINHETLVVYFVPSREPSEIIAATGPLKDLLQDALLEEGYNFDDIIIEVGTSYEAVGEALGAGTAHVGFIPGGTYVLYDDSAEVILTATRAGLNKDSEKAIDWNDGQPTQGTTDQVTYYRSILVAGPSEKGQAISAKVNNGEEITLEDLDALNWGVRSSSSSAGYIYPSIWLQQNYGAALTDLSNIVQTDSYGSTMARLASGQIDVGVIFADARRDYENNWVTEYGRTESIWDETNVIAVTPGIYNDTISVSKSADIMDADLIKALQNAFINIAATEEGKEVIAIYSHEGYKPAKSSDYDNEREAQRILRSFN